MIINDKKVNGNKFAFEGCHKFYIIEDESDEKEALEYGYKVYDLKLLDKLYNDCDCSLKFIDNWKLSIQYVKQFEDCIFKY